MLRYKKARGFSLVEVSMALAIGGVLMTSAMYMLSNYLRTLRMKTTQERMKDIDEALIQFLGINGVLPCPASLTDQQDSTTFGRQITDASVYPFAADCYAGAPNAAGGAFRATGRIPGGTNTTGYIVIGAVPTRTLNIADEEIADAWGNRFLYAVTNALTVDGSYDPTQGSIYIVDSNNAPVAVPAGSAQYVLVSHGGDRAGAYSLGGIASGVACPAGTLETRNCSLPTNTFRKTLLIGNRTGANFYDDYVTYRVQTIANGIVPTGLIAPLKLNACPSGWTPFFSPNCAASYTSGTYVCCQKQ